MIPDKKGQLSVEIIFIIVISIMVLIVFTVPLAQISIKNNMDIYDTLNSKSAVYKIANGIDEVYSQGKGSKITLNIELNKNLKVIIKNHVVLSKLDLHDGKSKSFKVNYKPDGLNHDLTLKKGSNKIIVEWNSNSDKINIFQST